jgi:hypothetical protein
MKKIVVVRQLFKINGVTETCLEMTRYLTDSGFKVTLASAIWSENRVSSWTDHFDEIVSSQRLGDADVIYFEGGYQTILQSDFETLSKFTSSGGIVILADCNLNDFQATNQFDRSKIEAFTGSRLAGPTSSPIEVRDFLNPGIDGVTNFETHGMRLAGIPSRAIIGVDNLTIDRPLVLELTSASPLLTTTVFSSLIRNDVFDRSRETLAPIASLDTFGNGYIACITGHFTHNNVFPLAEGNGIWLKNLLEELLN